MMQMYHDSEPKKKKTQCEHILAGWSQISRIPAKICMYSWEFFFWSPADFVRLPTHKEMISL